MTASAPDRRVIVPALGVTQILAWGFRKGGAGAVLMLLTGCATANLFFVGMLCLLVARLSNPPDG